MIKIFDFYELNTEIPGINHSIDNFKYSFYLNWLGNPILQIVEIDSELLEKNYLCHFKFHDDILFFCIRNTASSIDFKELVEHFNDITSIYLRYGRDIGSVCKNY